MDCIHKFLHKFIKTSLPLTLIDQAEKGGMVPPPEGKFMKLGEKVNFMVLSSKIDVIRAKKGFFFKI